MSQQPLKRTLPGKQFRTSRHVAALVLEMSPQDLRWTLPILQGCNQASATHSGTELDDGCNACAVRVKPVQSFLKAPSLSLLELSPLLINFTLHLSCEGWSVRSEQDIRCEEEMLSSHPTLAPSCRAMLVSLSSRLVVDSPGSIDTSRWRSVATACALTTWRHQVRLYSGRTRILKGEFIPTRTQACEPAHQCKQARPPISESPARAAVKPALYSIPTYNAKHCNLAAFSNLVALPLPAVVEREEG